MQQCCKNDLCNEENHNRVTIYRILNEFLEDGIVLRIVV